MKSPTRTNALRPWPGSISKTPIPVWSSRRTTRAVLKLTAISTKAFRHKGKVGSQDHRLTILVNRHELTGADREWADRYEPGDVIRYTRGSSRIGVKEGEYATVVHDR